MGGFATLVHLHHPILETAVGDANFREARYETAIPQLVAGEKSGFLTLRKELTHFAFQTNPGAVGNKLAYFGLSPQESKAKASHPASFLMVSAGHFLPVAIPIANLREADRVQTEKQDACYDVFVYHWMKKG